MWTEILAQEATRELPAMWIAKKELAVGKRSVAMLAMTLVAVNPRVLGARASFAGRRGRRLCRRWMVLRTASHR